ncbi:MAG: ABC transporter ATP-binding protein [Lachnospiraceae bacterium]|nr:ABC transporter ATP-binding protein [Lachnospiraceae bacterium]
MIRILKKFNLILSSAQKRKILAIVVLMLVGAILETLSVSLVVPLMTALMQKDFLETNRYAILVCRIFDIESENSFVLMAIAALIVVFILKDFFLYFEYYVQTRFICNNRVLTQRRLMEVYLERPYEFFLNASSGEIIRVIKNDTAGTFSLLSTVMSFFTEAIVAVALLFALIVVDPYMAVMVSVLLSIIMVIVYKLVKPTLRRVGIESQHNNAVANTWILQSVAGVKEMKVSHKEQFFVAQYSLYAQKAIDAEKVSTVLGNAPRLIIEAITISGMLGYIGFMIYRGAAVSDLLPQLSAFAVAAVRLLPCANRMSTALNSIAYQEPQLDKTIENLKAADAYEKEDEKVILKKQKAVGDITLNKSCRLDKVVYAYPNTEKNVLDCVDMEIPVGKSVGIIGSSGAGKTTAVDILLGLLEPKKGTVLSDEVDIQDNYGKWLSHLSYIPQMIYMLDDTIRANVAFGYDKDKTDDEQVWKALDEAQLGNFVRSLPEGLDTSIGERGVRLSGGQRQRIGIARALYTNPEMIILDEATSALDNETEAAIMESINSLHGKKTLVIIAHRLSTIKECDIVYKVNNGKIEKTQITT